jgi:hypothetical protein
MRPATHKHVASAGAMPDSARRSPVENSNYQVMTREDY